MSGVIYVSLGLLFLPTVWWDLRYQRIWIPWVWLFFAEELVLILLGTLSWKAFLLGLVPGMVLLLVSVVGEQAVGKGDGWITCVLGGLIGWERVLVVLTIGAFGAAILGGILMLGLHRSRKTTIPFVPFLAAATLLELTMELVG